MCSILKVSQSAFYDWCVRPISAHSKLDKRLTAMIIESYELNRGVYGARKIKYDLSDLGFCVSRARINRLMLEQGLRSESRRKFKATTNSKHGFKIHPNLLARNFSADSPNQAYVGDITYIRTGEAWLYLAVVIDLYSKAVVGWAMSNRMSRHFVVKALSMAINLRRPEKGLVVHTDRGSQYASNLYKKLLKDHGFKCSMSRKGDCWDNAPAESFFASLKKELIYRTSYETREEAQRAIFEYIEVFFNRIRRHSSIGYQAPLVFEQNTLKSA